MIPLRSAEALLNLPDALISLAWAPDATAAVVAGAGGGLWLLDATLRSHRAIGAHEDGAFQVAWDPKGARFASVGQDRKVRFWSADGQPGEVFDAGTAWVEHLAWAPSGEWLAVGAGKVVHLWHRERGWIHHLSGHPSTVSGLSWRSDSRVLGVAAYGGVRLYQVDDGQATGSLPWKTSMVSLAWSPNDRWVVAGTQELAIQVWPYPFEEGEELAMSGYQAKVRELAWHHSGRYLATGGGTEAMVWDCGGKGPAGTTPRILEGHTGRITALAYQHRGHLLASGGADGSVLFWNAGKSSAPLRQVRLSSAVTCLAAAPNDSAVLAACHNGDVALIRFP